MALFAPWLAVPARDDAVRAAGLARERYVRLVSAERPAWERFRGPGRALRRLGCRPWPARYRERDIVRAGLDPAVLSPAEVYAAKLVLGVAVLAVGLALSAIVPIALLVALPLAFVGYIFPTEYLGWLGRRRKAQLLRELPDFLALVRPLAERHGLERAVADVADALHRASNGRNLLGEQVRGAVAAYGTGVDLYAALRDVAAAADLEELDELAGSLAQAVTWARASARCSPSTSARCATASATGCSARPRPSSPSSPRSWPASTCPSSCCSSCCPCSFRRSAGSEGRR